MSCYPYLLKFLVIGFFATLMSCASSADPNHLGLAEGEFAYYLSNNENLKRPGACSLVRDKETFKLNFRATDKPEGMIITVSNVEPYALKKYSFNNDVSIIMNSLLDGELVVFVSSGCEYNKGTLEIVNWDKEAKTITGRFNGPLCTRGIFAHLPGVEIKDAGFYKIKYSELK